MPRFHQRSGSSLALGAVLLLGTCAAAQQTKTPAHPAQKPQIPTIEANTTLVDVPVLVLDKQGQPLLALTQGDFRIFDDGRPQQLSGFDDSPRPVSLAIVVDTYNWDAIGQAKRAALLISSMVVGAEGTASIYIPGPQPQCILAFTGDTNKIADALGHLELAPAAPQGEGSIVAPLNMAMLALQHESRARTRAALVISPSNARGEGASALLEGGRSDAIPIFRISPNTPANATAHINPDSVEQGGVGQGSNRVQAPPAPMNNRGTPTSGAGNANLDLAPIIKGVAGFAGKYLAPHHLDYVFYTGGMTYDPGNDHQFDQKLSLIGEELRSFYHLFYSPNDLTLAAEVHSINVELDVPPTTNVGHTTFRRTYLGIQGH